MPNDRRRILELALEALELKKKQVDEEIAEITRELRGKTAAKKSAQATPQPAPAKTSASKKASARKKTKFTQEEKLRRSKRMKEYWANWHKKKASAK